MSDTLKKLREPAALAAVAYAGLVVLAAVINLLVPPSSTVYSVTGLPMTSHPSFSSRAYDQAPHFLSFTVALAIGVAVYLANELEPALERARLITMAAVIEGGVASVFGVISALALFGAGGAGQQELAQFFHALGGGAVVGIATWYAWLTWQKHAPVKPQRGAAGTGWPGAGGPGGGYPGQTPPPGGFGWSPQQPQPPYGGQPGVGVPGAGGQAPMPGQPQPQGSPQPFGSDQHTQMLPPIPGGAAPVGVPGQPPVAPGMPGQGQAQQPVLPPTMQGYAAQPQPWSPGVTGQQQIPQQPQAQPQPQPQQSEQDQRSNNGGFPIGDWRSE
jgi:hypothetical protein